MQKINLLFILIVFCSGCSALRKGEIRNIDTNEKLSYDNFYEGLKSQNLSRKSFFIQKAEIEISNYGESKKFLASIKFKYPDIYSISLRSKTGIEAARIYILKDTVLINDRINRKQYSGSKSYYKEKYGLEDSILPVVFGDYIEKEISKNNKAECLNGNLNIDYFIEGILVSYTIDCKKKKCINAILENEQNKNKIDLNFSDFLINNGKYNPGKIEVRVSGKDVKVSIKIRKIDNFWDGNIDFIPGSNYEIIELK